jgi:S1-C subfamily serine protease
MNSCRGFPGIPAGLILAAILSIFIGAIHVAAADPDGTKANRIEDSVVKVFATARYPDVYKPWTKQAPREITGSGVVLERKRILTNAHIVLFASQVQVQANQTGEKIPATVEAVAYGIDLAVLKLDDESFFDSHPPLPRASTLPEIKDPVMTYGFPTGGTSLSITRGIVSRIEFTSYNYPVSGLRIQIDAAINPGNSGGPAVVGDKMIGLAFSHLRDAQNIGYIIPCEEIELFLRSTANGRYDGKPALFDEFQTLENPALQIFLNLDKTVKGIVVHEPYAAAGYPLKKWDVITKIGDAPVDEEGMVKIRDTLRVGFLYLVQKIARNGMVPLTVVRGGKEIPVEVPVTPTRSLLIADLQGAYPSYFVYGPLVFSPVTMQFVGALSNEKNGANLLLRLNAGGNPVVRRFGDKPAFPGEELVVVSSPFFPHKLSKGYSNPIARVVKTINGVPIKNLRHLVEVLRDSTAEFTIVEFEGREMETLVFSHKEMVAATDEILTDNGIRTQGSPDTLVVWNAKSPH